MNIAFVLYGQPRDYIKGYNNIMDFCKKQVDCKFDFFYHCWILNENETYNHSPWRNINKNELSYKKNTVNDLKQMYNPISYKIENQNEITFDESLYKNTLAYNNIEDNKKILNINNTLFQLYSRNKARNLLDIYLKNNNNVNYDFVITLRFDINVMPLLQFNILDKTKVYVSNTLYPRKIIPDNCIISPTRIFLEWFNIYDMINEILDNKSLFDDLRSLKESLEINPEELILAKYIFQYKNIDNILYFQGGLI
jgi:hypothetical protein